MNTKKTIAGLSALSVLISSGAFTAMTAFAAETTDYTTGKITAHLYSDEVLRDIECRYYSDMPNVPYIKLSDYYSCWMSQYPDQELEITNNNDGTYNVKVPYGTVGTIDTNKETIETDNIAYFMAPEYTVSDDRYVLEFYYSHRNDAPEELVHAVMTNTDMWGQDLTEVPGFEAETVRILKTIRGDGALRAFGECLK